MSSQYSVLQCLSYRGSSPEKATIERRDNFWTELSPLGPPWAHKQVLVSWRQRQGWVGVLYSEGPLFSLTQRARVKGELNPRRRSFEIPNR